MSALWIGKCFWCREDFNGDFENHEEYDDRPFHPICIPEFIAYKRSFKEKSDGEREVSQRLINIR